MGIGESITANIPSTHKLIAAITPYVDLAFEAIRFIPYKDL